MSSRIILTEELLVKHNACKDGIIFAKNFNLLGLCLGDVEIEGDFRGYVKWFKSELPHTYLRSPVNQYEFKHDSKTITDPNEPVIDEIKNSEGYWEEYTRDSKGNVLTYKTSNGFWREHTYDSNGNVLTFKNSDDDWKEYTYDSHGNTLTFKDSTGANETYRYETSDEFLVNVFLDGELVLSIKKK